MSDHLDMNQDDLLQQAICALRQTAVPNGPSPEDVTKLVSVLEKTVEHPGMLTLKKRTSAMKPIAKITAAATILLAVGSLAVWTLSSGVFTSLALANVADALDSLRSATFEMTSEVKREKGQPPVTMAAKGFFLAPSHQRIEMSMVTGPDKIVLNRVTIVDGQTAKSMMLMPEQKFAVSMDMKKMREDMKESGKLAKDAPADVFEIVRRLVREGSSGTGEKAEKLGKKKIDGREAVGFRIKDNMMKMVLWADPETGWPIRIEIVMDIMMTGVRTVMNNFRYNVDLDPLLFSLELPEGYSTQTMEMTMPVEEDLLRTLRTLAEHSEGLFPTKFGMNKEVMKPLMAAIEPELDKLKSKYGQQQPSAIASEVMKASMPLLQEQMRGITFYIMLKPENDAHYVGDGVKLGTSDRPILWYKPTDAKNYRAIYADLSVKEVAPEELKDFPEASDP